MNKENMRAYIRSDAVNKTINPEKQARHDRASSEYIPGRSYLLEGVDAQELVDRYHGTGRAEATRAGIWKNKGEKSYEIVGIQRQARKDNRH